MSINKSYSCRAIVISNNYTIKAFLILGSEIEIGTVIGFGQKGPNVRTMQYYLEHPKGGVQKIFPNKKSSRNNEE